ncbi:MAG: DUF2079 domain-containing protein [bacterium]|nr:DUF2079 domain-containing protein [bacterium]
MSSGLFAGPSILPHGPRGVYQAIPDFGVRNSHDFSMIDEALYQSHKGALMHSPVLGRSFFSEHFSPILLLLVPLHWILSSPYLLVFAQPLALLGAGLVVRGILLREGHELWIANLGLVLWLNNPFVIKPLEYLAHMECFLPLLVLGAYLAYRNQQYLLCGTLMLGALAVKEDVGLYIAGFGVWLAFKERRIWVGALTAAAGLAWTVLSLEFVIPYFAEGDSGFRFMGRWQQWGDGMIGIALGFILHPLQLLSALLQEAPLHLFACFLFLPFFSRWGWLLFMAPWLVNATSAHQQQAELGIYYGIPLITFATIAAIEGLKSPILKKISCSRATPALVIILTVLNLAHFTYPPIELGRREFIGALKMLPPAVPVHAAACFFPVLGYTRPKLLITDTSEISGRWVALRAHSSTWPLSESEAKAVIQETVYTGRYEVMAEVNGCYLLRRKTPGFPPNLEGGSRQNGAAEE